MGLHPDAAGSSRENTPPLVTSTNCNLRRLKPPKPEVESPNPEPQTVQEAEVPCSLSAVPCDILYPGIRHYNLQCLDSILPTSKQLECTVTREW